MRAHHTEPFVVIVGRVADDGTGVLAWWDGRVQVGEAPAKALGPLPGSLPRLIRRRAHEVSRTGSSLPLFVGGSLPNVFDLPGAIEAVLPGDVAGQCVVVTLSRLDWQVVEP